ncbi:MAG: DUF92 domain-containing protein [Nitrososphaerota archaeon]
MNLSLAIEMVIVISIFSILSHKLKILDIAGTTLAAAIGTIIYSTIGRVGFIVITVFVVTAGIFTKLGYDRKSRIGAAEPRKGLRGWRNVVGNGLVAASAALAYALLPAYSEVLLGCYIGAVAAVFSDTLATETGLLSKGEPRLIIGFKKVRAGTPGGVTLVGYLGSLLAPLMLILGYIPVGGVNPLSFQEVAAIVFIAGLVGTSVDSAVGQLLQGTYRCEVCKKITESKNHCGRPTVLLKGYSLIDNHVVNLICSLSGAVVGAVVMLAFYNTV